MVKESHKALPDSKREEIDSTSSLAEQSKGGDSGFFFFFKDHPNLKKEIESPSAEYYCRDQIVGDSVGQTLRYARLVVDPQ